MFSQCGQIDITNLGKGFRIQSCTLMCGSQKVDSGTWLSCHINRCHLEFSNSRVRAEVFRAWSSLPRTTDVFSKQIMC